MKCIHNPTSTCPTENWKQDNWGKQPMVDVPIQRYGVKQSQGKVITHTNLGQILQIWMFYRSTAWTSNGWAATAAWLRRDGSGRSRVRIKNVQHTQSAATKRWRLNYRKSWFLQSLATERTWRSISSHWRTILHYWKHKCIIATKERRGVHKDTLR